MPSWTLIETHPTQGRTFQRPLDAIELVTYWGSLQHGASDILYPVELRLLDASRDAHLFSDANIVQAWLSTKRRHPLAGATIHMLGDGGDGEGVSSAGTSEPYFVIQEHDLAVRRPNEIVFGQVACQDEVQAQISAILDGPRPISNALLAQLYVFREADPARADIVHLITLVPHFVSDGMGIRSFVRCLVDTLARGGALDVAPGQIPLEERLAMIVPPVDLPPVHLRTFSLARRRWRMAAAAVTFKLRMAKPKGGHTLPCRAAPHAPQAARSGFVSTLLTEAQTSTVIANCRQHQVSFGNAYIVLAQVAMTRVLYRRYLRGEISEDEWAYRKRQPYHNMGPLNLRPYLDKEWFERGGGGEFMLCASLYLYTLPFMTLGGHQDGHASSGDAPPFSDLLTFSRFLHRVGLVKKQAKAFFGHPLFLEIIRAGSLERGRYTRMQALQSAELADKVPAVRDIPMVFGHGGSTLGNVHLISPTEYPLPSSHPLSPVSSVSNSAKAGYVTYPLNTEADAAPRIVVENAMPVSRSHTRPGELTLGALTSRGRMGMYVFYDRNVYEDEMVKEWLDEVQGSVLWYLGQTHSSATP